MPSERKRQIRGVPINTLAPNILTLLALCAGLTAVRFALNDRFELAVASILIAAVLDGLDGRIARLLKGATKFGAEFDSLSDFVSFGVAPALVLYFWTMDQLARAGWIVVLVFAVCCALRLARFNTALEDKSRPAWAGDYFTGISAPLGACSAMLPMLLDFQLENGLMRNPVIVAGWTVVIALLMVSQVPTYSFKRLRVKREYVLPMLLATALIAAGLLSYPWTTLSIAGFLYLATIPLSIRSHARQKRATARAAAADVEEAALIEDASMQAGGGESEDVSVSKTED